MKKISCKGWRKDDETNRIFEFHSTRSFLSLALYLLFVSWFLKSAMTSINEITLSKSSLVKKEFGKVASYSFEVTIPTNVPDQFNFVFQNYYTSSITIAQEISTGLKILVDKKILMEDSSNEVQAYDWHIIPGSALMQKGFQKGRPLRIYLFQSTDLWTKIDLRNLKVVSQKTDGVTAAPTSNEPALTSMSACLVNDLKVVTEACRVQASLKQTAEYYYTQPDETKRAARRKDRKKGETRRSTSQENPNF